MAVRVVSTLRKGLFWQLYVPWLTVTAIALCLFGAVALVLIDNFSPEHQVVLAYWLAVAFVGALGFAAVGSVVISQRALLRLREIRVGARRLARGDLSFRLPVRGTDDLSGLADALNTMASQLESRIHQLLAQHKEQQAVLGSMAEGVVALDSSASVINVNAAARRLLGLGSEDVLGKNIYELVRNYQLHQVIQAAFKSSEPVRTDVTIEGETYCCVQVHGTPLQTEGEAVHGIVLVLDDVTRLRKLEEVRRDFVANVSHELRTPITSIKGFVETLLDGALENPTDARRFLAIIQRQVNSLNAIIEDLLKLSRLEANVESGGILTSPTSLEEVLSDVVELVKGQASEKEIQILIECHEKFYVDVNRTLFEQALLNLVLNGIKYSERNREVQIRARAFEDGVVIEVQDQGWGIERHHIPRLFERFYRVDRARDKRSGGSGLGLSIVKHVIAAHRGKIEVESAPGSGSTFRILLPSRRVIVDVVDGITH